MGEIRLAERDYRIFREIERWRVVLGRHIVVLAEFSGQRACDRRLKRLIEAGFITRKKILYGVPNIYSNTHKTKVLTGLPLRADKIKVEQIGHDLVNKSRSAGVTCVLATQSLSDLDFACGSAFKEQIIENCNNYLVMRQNSGINAEHWSNILGTRSTLEVTYQLQQKGLNTAETGFGSAKRVREFFYHPDDIKTLQIGQGIFLSRDGNYHNKIKVNKPF